MEAHPSNIETAAQMENIQHLPTPSHPPTLEEVQESVHHLEAVMERAHHGGGWLLSGIICINILILGCALVSGSAFNSVAITAVHRQIFLIILLLLTMLWMLFYAAFTTQKEQAVLFKDSHAGPVWLRGENSLVLSQGFCFRGESIQVLTTLNVWISAGLVLFGLLSFLMDIFKIANYVGYLHCDSAVKVAFPVVQAVFLFVQVVALSDHYALCIHAVSPAL